MMQKKVILFAAALLLSVKCEEDFGDSSFGDEDEYGDEDVFDGDGGYGGGYGDYGGGMDDEYGGEHAEIGPGFETLDTKEAADEFLALEELEPAVLGFFDEERDEEAFDVFKEVAEANRYDFRFGVATELEVREAFKYSKSPVVLVHPPPRFVSEKFQEKKRARYPSAKLDADALLKFLYKKSVPLVGQKTWKANDRYEKLNVPILTLYASIDLEKNAKGFEYFANRLRKVAVDFKDKMLFQVGDKDDFSYGLDDYGFENKLEDKKDVGVGVKHGNKFWRMTSKFNVDNLRLFVTDVLAGAIEPKIKEEEEEPDSSPDYDDAENDFYEASDVVSLTSENFDDETSGKDAFLEFYAPWCGHCQALKPVYRDLATRLKPYSDSLVVAAMDASTHDPPSGFDVSGYPTILFKPNGADPIPYDDDRDLDSMLDFAAQHASFDLNRGEL